MSFFVVLDDGIGGGRLSPFPVFVVMVNDKATRIVFLSEKRERERERELETCFSTFSNDRQ
jgi:hypothetical protein